MRILLARLVGEVPGESVGVLRAGGIDPSGYARQQPDGIPTSARPTGAGGNRIRQQTRRGLRVAAPGGVAASATCVGSADGGRSSGRARRGGTDGSPGSGFANLRASPLREVTVGTAEDAERVVRDFCDAFDGKRRRGAASVLHRRRRLPQHPPRTSGRHRCHHRLHRGVLRHVPEHDHRDGPPGRSGQRCADRAHRHLPRRGRSSPRSWSWVRSRSATARSARGGTTSTWARSPRCCPGRSSWSVGRTSSPTIHAVRFRADRRVP